MDKITKSLLETFSAQNEIERLSDSVQFEHFSNYSIVSKLNRSSFELDDIHTGNGGDCAIDGLCVIANGKIIVDTDELNEVIEGPGYLDAEIVFISHKDLNSLYEKNSNWLKFGRLLAELFFGYAQTRAEEFMFFSHEERYLRLLEEHPNIIERIPAYHISSFLGITNPSLSRIRKRIKNSS